MTDEPDMLLRRPVLRCGGPVAVNRDSASRAPETSFDDIYRSTYFLGGQRIAESSAGQNASYVYYIFTDHLGTVRLETYGNGAFEGETRAPTPTLPYGGVRHAIPASGFWYTGQYFDRSEDLYDYGARPYDPLLGLFIQPDTVVPDPGDPQLLNRYSYVRNSPLNYVDPTGHDLMIVGGAGGDLDPETWQEWIMMYKGWSLNQWSQFYEAWEGASDLTGRNDVLFAEGIGIFAWGGDNWDSANANAGSVTTNSMVDELAKQMAGMQDVTLLGWSKGGNLVLQYLWAQEMGQLEGTVAPVRAVLLAPGTHPAGPLAWGASWVRNEVPSAVSAAVSICSHGDATCPLTIRNAENINPPWEGNFHGPHGRYASQVMNALDIDGHHQARARLPRGLRPD